MNDPLVKIHHIRAARLCMGGARRWFAARGLDWAAFLRDGLPASVLSQWGDPLAERAIDEAKKESADER